jgi:hypothetical protein
MRMDEMITTIVQRVSHIGRVVSDDPVCIKSRYLTAKATLHVANGMFHIAVWRPYPLISTVHPTTWVFNVVVSQRGKVILQAINTVIDAVVCPLLPRMEIGSEIT